MATFGPVTSPFANVLYNPMAVDQAVQGRQRNQLMMDNARQDQAYQNLDRDRQEVARVSGSLMSLPEDQRPAAYTAAVRQLQSQGFARQAPAQYPGHQQIEALARQGMTPTEQFKLAEQRRQNDAFMGLLGGAPAAGSAAPAGGAAPGPAASATPPPEMMPHFQAASAQTGIPVPLLVAQAQQESGFRPDAVGRAGEIGVMQIMPSTARNPGYGMQGVDPATLRDPAANIAFGAQYLRARAGQASDMTNPQAQAQALRSYNGGGDPNYVQNVTRNMPAAQAPAPAAPAMPQLDQNGLTQQQRALVAAAGPERGIGMMAQFQQQNRMEVDRISDRQRQAERDAIQQQQQLVTNERQDAAARRADETARRQDEAANRRIRLDEERAAREANPGPSPTDRTKLKTIETEADGILGALEAYRTARTNASSTSRIASAAGLPTELNSTYGNAALLAKGEALYNLGVLNGPDLGIIRRVLADPGTVTGGMASQATVDAQIDQVKALLQQRLATARTQYGGAPAARQEQPAGGLMDGAQPPPPGRSATAPAAPRGGPQVGAVEDGYRFRGGDPSKPESWERAQ